MCVGEHRGTGWRPSPSHRKGGGENVCEGRPWVSDQWGPVRTQRSTLPVVCDGILISSLPRARVGLGVAGCLPLFSCWRLSLPFLSGCLRHDVPTFLFSVLPSRTTLSVPLSLVLPVRLSDHWVLLRPFSVVSFLFLPLSNLALPPRPLPSSPTPLPPSFSPLFLPPSLPSSSLFSRPLTLSFLPSPLRIFPSPPLPFSSLGRPPLRRSPSTPPSRAARTPSRPAPARHARPDMGSTRPRPAAPGTGGGGREA